MKDHGFALIESRYLDELKSTLYEYEYTRTGTHLFYMDNGLDNKLFSIAFKTTYLSIPCSAVRRSIR